jgi:hypothetical protein
MSILEKTQREKRPRTEQGLNRSETEPLGRYAYSAYREPKVSEVSVATLGVPPESEITVLSEVSKARLKRVVYELVKDAVRWYRDDIEDIAKMDHQALKDVVLLYFAQEANRRYYQPERDDP